MNMKALTRSLSVLLIVFTMCESCNATPKSEFKKILETHKEQGFGRVLPDSISNIILDANKIICELVSKNPTDTLRKDSVTIVPSKLRPIVKFLFFNEQNFQSNDTVFANFDPWVCYKFETYKRHFVYLEMDFGLRKWRLLDKNKKQIYGADMKELNMQFLYFTRLLFPQDLTLKFLNDNLNAIE